jgi:hypothetical protein
MLTFISKENQRHRDYFQHLFERTFWFLTGIVTIACGFAVFLGINTINGAKEAAQQAARTQAREATDAQIAKLKPEIDNRISKEFETPTIEQIVREKAQEATATTAHKIIVEEVDNKVGEAVNAEREDIHSTLKSAAANAVNEVKSTIQSEAAKDAREIIKAEIQPQLDVAASYNSVARDYSLALLGLADSFDRLYAVSKQPGIDPGLNAVAVADVRNVIDIFPSHRPSPILCPSQPGDLELAQEQLKSNDWRVYSKYLECFNMFDIRNKLPGPLGSAELSPNAQSALQFSYRSVDRLFIIMTTAPGLGDRYVACNDVFSIVITARPQLGKDMPRGCFDKESYLSWWQVHRKEFVP